MAFRVQSAVMRLYQGLRKGGGVRSGDWVVPVLAVVVYNGKSRWIAPTRMGDLVRPEARPAAVPPRHSPTFTGDSYIVIDIGQYYVDELPQDNVVSVVIRTEQMDGLESAGKVFEEAWRQLDRPELKDLREHYLAWFNVVLELQGVKWKALEDPMEIARLAEAGELRTTLEERVQARDAALRAEVREEVREKARKEAREEARKVAREERLEAQRELLKGLAQNRFGAEMAGDLVQHLAAITEFKQLLSVGDWILACTSGSELLDRVKAEF